MTPHKKESKESPSPAQPEQPTQDTEAVHPAEGASDSPTTPQEGEDIQLEPGYVYAKADDAPEEFDEESAAESLTHQLLRKGETIDKEQLREEKKLEKEEKRREREKAVLGTAVGGLVGSRASDTQLNAAGKPVLPTESRTTEISSRKTSKSGLGFMGLAAATALVVGGLAAGIPKFQDYQQQKASLEQPASEQPAATTDPAAEALDPAPAPSIIERVPEVSYVEVGDQPVEPGTVEYLDSPEIAEQVAEAEAPAENPATEEALMSPVTEATQETLEVAPSAAPQATEAPVAAVIPAPAETAVSQPEALTTPLPVAPVQVAPVAPAPADSAPVSTLPSTPAADTGPVQPTADALPSQLAPSLEAPVADTQSEQTSQPEVTTGSTESEAAPLASQAAE